MASQTADFVLACMQARSRAGGGRASSAPEIAHGFGMDEKGGVTIVNNPGSTVEVVALQGYVYEKLKNLLGNKLQKPKRDGYCVDGLVTSNNVLIEIKTGIFAHNIYEAVGQLHLYPTLIGIYPDPDVVLLVPDEPELKPNMVAAIAAAGVELFTYSIDRRKRKTNIDFPEDLIERLGGAA